MVAIAVRASAQGTPPPPVPVPITSLVAAYPYGEQQCAVPVPGNARVVVAQGATLAIVDTTAFVQFQPGDPLEPKELQSIEIPGVTPLALRYRQWSDAGTEKRAVFVAGGTTGVWRVPMCNDLFTSSNPAPCSAAAELIERVGCDPRFAYKRCVDIEIVEGNSGAGGDGLLLALFAASSQLSERVSLLSCYVPGDDLGGTELRAYRLKPDGSILAYATHVFSAGNVGPPMEEVGVAIAPDPGDAGRVFVSLGAGGIRKVDISTAAFSSSPVSISPVPSCTLPNFQDGSAGCTQGDQIRDLAVVRLSGGQALLYAALEYGRVVEMDPDVAGSATAFALDEAFPMRIAASVVPGDNVVVGVALDKKSGVQFDSAAPFRPVGVWWGMCVIPELPDWNNLPSTSVQKVRLLARSPASPLADVASFASSAWPGSLEFLPTGNPYVVRLHASSGVVGLQNFRLSFSTGSGSWTLSNLWGPPGYQPFRGKAMDVADVYLSGVDDSLVMAGFDGWAHDHPGRIARIDPTGGVAGDVLPIPLTSSACATRATAFPVLECAFPSEVKHVDPVPFRLGVAGVAIWKDPFDPLGQKEWMLAGQDTTWFASTSPTCIFQPDNMRCMVDPCPAAPNDSPWAEGKHIPGCVTNVGWQLKNMRTLAPATGPFDGTVIAPQWWQLPSDNVLGDSTRSPSAPYTSCTADPRTLAVGAESAPVPQFVHLARNGAMNGYKIVRPVWLMDRALGGVPGSPAGGPACPSGMRGLGEPLATPSGPQPWSGPYDLEMASFPTHLELATAGCLNSPQIIKTDCFAVQPSTELETSRRMAFNQSAHVFSVRDAQQVERWVVAIAAGFVTSSGPAACPWKDYYRRALTVFYDVTALDPAAPVTGQNAILLAAAVGPRLDLEQQLPSSDRASHSFSVKTRTYSNGRTLAFVADLLGRVLVYDVSWDKLTTVGPPPAVGIPGQTSKPLLVPYAQHRFAQDPFDGKRPNCVALEVNDEALYCAVGRGGIHVLDIHSIVPGATQLPTYAVVDSAGMCTGIAQRLRGPGLWDDQLVVGDSRGGLLLLGRAGP